jgi:hypothetical protein
MSMNYRSNTCKLTERESRGLYREQRRTMLHFTQVQRRAGCRRSELAPYQRQLGLLREAYRHTMEAIAWQRYADTWYDAR